MKNKKKLTPDVVNTIYNRLLDFIGFLTVVLFIIAKLMKWIDITWLWVLVPMFLPDLFYVGVGNEEDENNNDDDENPPDTLKLA